MPTNSETAAAAAPIERELVGETIVGVARSAPAGLLMLDTASGRTFQICGRITGDNVIEIVELEGAR